MLYDSFWFQIINEPQVNWHNSNEARVFSPSCGAAIGGYGLTSLYKVPIGLWLGFAEDGFNKTSLYCFTVIRNPKCHNTATLGVLVRRSHDAAATRLLQNPISRFNAEDKKTSDHLFIFYFFTQPRVRWQIDFERACDALDDTETRLRFRSD